MSRPFQPPPPGIDPRYSSFMQNTQAFQPPEETKASHSQEYKPGVPMGGWADDDDIESLRRPGQMSLSHQHAPPPATIIPPTLTPPSISPMQSYEQPKAPELAQSTEPGFYESRLVEAITQPGGARQKPPEKELTEFAGNCKYLNCEVVSKLLYEKLSIKGRGIKALFVLEKLARTYEGYQNLIKLNRQQITDSGKETANHQKVAQSILNIVDGVREQVQSSGSVNLLEEPKMKTNGAFDLNMGRNVQPPPAQVIEPTPTIHHPQMDSLDGIFGAAPQPEFTPPPPVQVAPPAAPIQTSPMPLDPFAEIQQPVYQAEPVLEQKKEESNTVFDHQTIQQHSQTFNPQQPSSALNLAQLSAVQPPMTQMMQPQMMQYPPNQPQQLPQVAPGQPVYYAAQPGMVQGPQMMMMPQYGQPVYIQQGQYPVHQPVYMMPQPQNPQMGQPLQAQVPEKSDLFSDLNILQQLIKNGLG